MAEQRIDPKTISKPIQLLAAWLVALVLLVGALLTGASIIKIPTWAPALLVVAAVAIVPLFAGCVLLLQIRYRDQILADDAYLRLQTLVFDGVTKTIDRSLRAGSEEERIQTAMEDLPKLQAVIKSPRRSARLGPDSIRKLGDIVRELSNTSEWIADSIFVSGTYGYNVWPSEMENMQKEQLIEVRDQRVRLTEKGVRLAKDYNRSRLDKK